MSAKEKLDRLESDWADHMEWREKGDGRLDDNGKHVPGVFIVKDARGNYIAGHRALPQAVRERIANRIEDWFLTLVDELYEEVRSEHIVDAIAEARSVLAQHTRVEKEPSE